MLPIDELNVLRSQLRELVSAVQHEAEQYDNIDFLIDLLASTVVPIVEEWLETEYDKAYRSGLEPWLNALPDDAARTRALYTPVGGKTFAERIKEYAAGNLGLFVSKVETLLETDGHRVRSTGTLHAGETLSSVGLTVHKTWRGVLDEQERDAHIALEGVSLPLDGLFQVSGHTAPAPGLFNNPALDCNCRCELEISVT